MPTEQSILVVEDDEDIRDMISLVAAKKRYSVLSLRNGLEAKRALEDGYLPGAIVLDINMPGMDGFTLCRWLRERHPVLPVIFLSARTDEYDKLLGLEVGGDDYLTKPFSMEELFARISVNLRRLERIAGLMQTQTPDEQLRCGDLHMNLEHWTCFFHDQEVTLSVSEFRILAHLVKEPGRVFSREQLGKAAFPEDLYYSGRGVDIHISRLRRKLVAVDPAFSSLESVYRVGYRWKL